MKKSLLACTILAASFLNSCNLLSPVAGKTFYLLNIKDLGVQETQLDFKSDNTIDARFTLNANSMDCYHYKNTSSLSEQSVIMHYSVNGDVLTIDELNLSIRTDQISNEDMFYKTSIVEHLNDSVGYKRILAHSFSASLVDMYMTMINNNNESPLGEEVIVPDPNGGRGMKTFKINSNKNANNPYKVNPLGGNSN